MQAKRTVEEQLGLQNIGIQAPDYQTALKVYEDYYSKVNEINQSQASNKHSLLMMAESQLQNDLAAMNLEKQQRAAEQSFELIKGYQDERRKIEIEQQVS